MIHPTKPTKPTKPTEYSCSTSFCVILQNSNNIQGENITTFDISLSSLFGAELYAEFNQEASSKIILNNFIDRALVSVLKNQSRSRLRPNLLDMFDSQLSK